MNDADQTNAESTVIRFVVRGILLPLALLGIVLYLVTREE